MVASSSTGSLHFSFGAEILLAHVGPQELPTPPRVSREFACCTIALRAWPEGTPADANACLKTVECVRWTMMREERAVATNRAATAGPRNALESISRCICECQKTQESRAMGAIATSCPSWTENTKFRHDPRAGGRLCL